MSAAVELPAFFSRNGLGLQDYKDCLEVAATVHSRHSIRPIAGQGGCSFTLKVWASDAESTQFETNTTQTTIIQFRLPRHALPLHLVEMASRIYWPMAPFTHELGHVKMSNDVCLQACTMSCIPGARFSDIQPRTRMLDSTTLANMKTMLGSFAKLFAQSWHSGVTGIDCLSRLDGKVGSSILSRLCLLQQGLPSRALRKRARAVQEAVHRSGLDLLPVVLTHGDLIPSNIHVDMDTWIVKGYVDWTEAEYLPCGISLYGLEHLLGFIDAHDGEEPHFVCYEQADELRAVFWTAFERIVPAIAEQKVRDALSLARDVGILLWRGIAWDDGQIDRVVNKNDDSEELVYLNAFLHIKSVAERHDSILEASWVSLDSL